MLARGCRYFRSKNCKKISNYSRLQDAAVIEDEVRRDELEPGLFGLERQPDHSFITCTESKQRGQSSQLGQEMTSYQAWNGRDAVITHPPPARPFQALPMHLIADAFAHFLLLSSEMHFHFKNTTGPCGGSPLITAFLVFQLYLCKLFPFGHAVIVFNGNIRFS